VCFLLLYDVSSEIIFTPKHAQRVFLVEATREGLHANLLLKLFDLNWYWNNWQILIKPIPVSNFINLRSAVKEFLHTYAGVRSDGQNSFHTRSVQFRTRLKQDAIWYWSCFEIRFTAGVWLECWRINRAGGVIWRGWRWTWWSTVRDSAMRLCFLFISSASRTTHPNSHLYVFPKLKFPYKHVVHENHSF
jgi:hypothetical protein